MLAAPALPAVLRKAAPLAAPMLADVRARVATKMPASLLSVLLSVSLRRAAVLDAAAPDTRLRLLAVASLCCSRLCRSLRRCIMKSCDWTPIGHRRAVLCVQMQARASLPTAGRSWMSSKMRLGWLMLRMLKKEPQMAHLHAYCSMHANFGERALLVELIFAWTSFSLVLSFGGPGWWNCHSPVARPLPVPLPAVAGIGPALTYLYT